MNVSPSVACGMSLSDPGRTVSQALPSVCELVASFGLHSGGDPEDGRVGRANLANPQSSG